MTDPKLAVLGAPTEHHSKDPEHPANLGRIAYPMRTKAVFSPPVDLLVPPLGPYHLELEGLRAAWNWKNGSSLSTDYSWGYTRYKLEFPMPFNSQCVGLMFYSDTQLQWLGIPEGTGHWMDYPPFGDGDSWHIYHLQRQWYSQRMLASDDVHNPAKYRALCTVWP